MGHVAKVRVLLEIDGARVEIPAGDPIPAQWLSAGDAAELVRLGAIESIDGAQSPGAAGGDNTGTNTSESGSSAPPVAMAAGGEAGGALLEESVAEFGALLPDVPVDSYPLDAVPLDTSPARPDEPVPELARETQPVAATARKPRSK